jgi:hypothetical protein
MTQAGLLLAAPYVAAAQRRMNTHGDRDGSVTVSPCRRLPKILGISRKNSTAFTFADAPHNPRLPGRAYLYRGNPAREAA